MKTVSALARMMRLPNLAIVFLSQYLPYYMVLRPAILRGGGIPALDSAVFAILAFNTLLTTYAGYLVNDIFDAEIDARNKPFRLVVGKFISRETAFLVYFALIVSVLGLAIWLDLRFFPNQNFPNFILFGSVSALLFAYSRWLKCTPVLGNILVALLCALVPFVMFRAETRPLQLLDFHAPDIFQQSQVTFWNFVIFAALTTLFREMVKDIEDFAGDAACQCRTLPVLRGVAVARRWAAFSGVLLLACLVLLLVYWLETTAPTMKIMASILFLLLPALFAIAKTARGTMRADFSRASLAIKIIMLAGLFLLAWN